MIQYIIGFILLTIGGILQGKAVAQSDILSGMISIVLVFLGAIFVGYSALGGN